jgi:hypothetical protein
MTETPEPELEDRLPPPAEVLTPRAARALLRILRVAEGRAEEAAA